MKAEKKRGGQFVFPKNVVGVIADEVAKTVVKRLPKLLPRYKRRKTQKSFPHAIVLDTSAIIDGRIFDVILLGLIKDSIIVPEIILNELKRIADSQDAVKRERGRKGLEKLEQLKKRGTRFIVASEKDEEEKALKSDVDDRLIRFTKKQKGRVITCDYNLEKKASIQGVLAINVNALANCLKVTAVPGEALHVKILHQGKEIAQGVGYLDDGTMLVVEGARDDIGNTVDVVVSRVIQTAAGRILFAKKIL